MALRIITKRDYAASGEKTWVDGSPDKYVGVQGTMQTTDLQDNPVTRANAAQRQAHNGIARKLRILVPHSSENEELAKVTLMKGDADTELYVNIPSGIIQDGFIVEDEFGVQVPFLAGDELCYRVDLPPLGEPPDQTTFRHILLEVEEW